MKKLNFWRVASAALLLTLPLSAQLTIREPIQQLESKANRTIKGNVVVENSSSQMQGGHLKIERTGNERDMSAWVSLDTPYFNIPAKSAIKLRYRIKIPDNVSGSYWTKFLLRPTAIKDTGMVKIRTQLGGFLILDTPGGRSGLEFLDMRYEENQFFVDVKNSGSVFMRPNLTLYVDGQSVEAKNRLCFPGQTIQWKIPFELSKGKHFIVGIAMDKKGNYGFRRDIETGVETIKEIVSFVPIRFRLSSDVGSEGIRSLAHASASFGNWRLGAGGFAGRDSSRVNFSLGYNTKNLSLNAFTYTSNGDWRTSLGATLNLKRWLLSLHTSPFEEYGNLMIRRSFNFGYVAARFSVRPHNLDWNLTASIPFNLQLKFKKKIKQKEPDLQTIIFN